MNKLGCECNGECGQTEDLKCECRTTQAVECKETTPVELVWWEGSITEKEKEMEGECD